jgi:hypothetical protein
MVGHRLTKQRDESAMKRAKEMHDECMKDPEYAADRRSR